MKGKVMIMKINNYCRHLRPFCRRCKCYAIDSELSRGVHLVRCRCGYIHHFWGNQHGSILNCMEDLYVLDDVVMHFKHDKYFSLPAIFKQVTGICLMYSDRELPKSLVDKWLKNHNDLSGLCLMK